MRSSNGLAQRGHGFNDRVGIVRPRTVQRFETGLITIMLSAAGFNISVPAFLSCACGARLSGVPDAWRSWWGEPSWRKKKAKETPATFNARAETVAEKPMFRSVFKRKRCLIPASRFDLRQNPHAALVGAIAGHCSVAPYGNVGR